MRADMHNHSIYSDGILAPLELAHYGVSKGLDIIAITDHDSLKAFENELENLPISIIKGVELSTYYNNENIHLLGYFIDNESRTEIEETIEYYELKRKERIHRVIEKLKIYYELELTYEEIEKYADGAIGRVHVAKALEEKYKVPFSEVFDKYIGNNQLAYVPTENLDFQDAIELLHKNNAIAILAHPTYIKKNSIAELILMGLDGLEVYHPNNSLEEQIYYSELAKKYNLLITGGSDFHKYPNSKTDIDMGIATVSGEELQKILMKLNFKIKE